MSVDDIAKRFSQRLDRQEHASEARRTQAVEDMIRAFDPTVWRQVTLSAERQTKKRDLHTPSVNAQVSLGNAGILHQTDDLMWQAFQLDSVIDASALKRYSVVYCDTLEEFFTPILADVDISETQRRQYLAQMIAEAEANAEHGGTMGVNLPGRGCYVNGWIFGAMHDVSAKAALQDNSIFPDIFGTVVHEKLGHGFISDLTAVGKEKTQLGMWRFDVAKRFAMRNADSPHSTLLLRKHALIHQTSQFTEEGWATWVEQTMVKLAVTNGVLKGLGQEVRHAAPYTVESLGEFLQSLNEQAPEEAREAVQTLSAVLQLLLTEDEVDDPEVIFRVTQALHKLTPMFSEVFGQAFGQPMVYVVGYLLLDRLASRIGWRNVPYAVMIAGSVTYDLKQTSVSDLETLLASEPRLNVDARLALLSRLSLPKGATYRDLAHTARETFGFAVPDDW